MEINKSADSSVEFFGIRGIYVPYTLGGIMAIFILFLVLQALLPAVLDFGLTFTFLVMGIRRIKYLDKTYGDRGLDKLTAEKIQPRYLRQIQASVFTRLIHKK
jgi:hypothetical protein